MGRVDQKVTVITGGAKGIGRATSELLAREGARVAITDIADVDGEQLAVAIRAAGGQACYWHLNVANERQVDQVFSAIEQAYGTIDVLVNNAGIIGADKPTHELTVAEWQQVLDINVLGYGILYLASDEAKFVTGTELVIDGGYTAR